MSAHLDEESAIWIDGIEPGTGGYIYLNDSYIRIPSPTGGDDTGVLQAALDLQGTYGIAILLQGGRGMQNYRVTQPLLVKGRGAHIIGSGMYRGTQIDYFGTTGALFQIGTDDGNPWDAAEYNGVGGLALEHISLNAASASTPLTSGFGNYAPNTYAIQDWRGGDLILDHVFINGFDYNLWGIQSDLVTLNHVISNGTHSGMYFGPRSDQLTAVGCYFLLSDRDLFLDRVQGASFYGCTFVDSGLANAAPIKIGSAWSIASFNITFDHCWFEHFAGVNTIDSFIDFGVGDSVQSRGLRIISPGIYTAASGGGIHAKWLVKVDNASGVEIAYPGGQYVANLEDYVRYIGASGVCQVRVLADDYSPIVAPGITSAAAGGTFRPIIVQQGGPFPRLAVTDGTTKASISLKPDPTLPQLNFTDNAQTTRVQLLANVNSGILNIDAPGGLNVRDAVNGGNSVIKTGSNALGFFGTTPQAKPTVTGARDGNAAVASLISALAARGDLTDSTTAGSAAGGSSARVYTMPALQAALASFTGTASLFTTSTAPAALFPANTLHVGDVLRIVVTGQFFNNSGVSSTMSAAVKVGGVVIGNTALSTVATGVGSVREWIIELELEVITLGAAATSVIVGMLRSNVSGAGNSQIVVANTNDQHQQLTWNTTADAALDVTATVSAAANAALTATLTSVSVLRHPGP